MRVSFFLGVLFLTFIAVAFAQTLPPNQGCCTNPNAVGLTCLPVQANPTNPVVTQSMCCPPTQNSFYNIFPGGLGPTNFAQCIASYYFPAQYCNEVSANACQTGCCCDPLGSSTFPVLEVQCHNSAANFHPNLNQAQCNQQCAVQQTQCNDNVDNDQNTPVGSAQVCADEFDSGCGQPYNPLDTTESGGSCIVYGLCNNPLQPPQISSLSLSPLRGELKMQLSWVADCLSQLSQFQIYRCKNSGCTDFALVGTLMGTAFTDQSASLLWDTVYRYKVVGTYTVSGVTTTDEIIQEASIGNLECSGQLTGNPFCISQAYYAQFNAYLVANNIPISSFASRFNTGVACDAQNVLTTSQTCPGTQVCVVSNPQGVPSVGCSVQGNCNTASAGPFGLLVTRSNCEYASSGQRNYCVLDGSATIVDRCYACNPNMRCYDYHSQGACVSDNCGVGGCQWREYDAQFNRGVCISASQNNCQYCNQASSSPAIATKDAYNPVLDICTQSRASNLSTPLYPCVVIGNAAQSCSQVSCFDYAQSQCSAQAITHNALNVLLGASQDPCNFGVCQWYSNLGSCRKNADGILGTASASPDCALSNSACEHDVVAPITNLSVFSTNNLQDTIMLRVYDKLTYGASTVEVTQNPAVRTYFCVLNAQGTNCQGGHPYGSSTTSDVLTIYQLGLYDSVINVNTGFPVLLASFVNGPNVLRYYSEDAAHNIEVVKEVTINAYANPLAPQIAGIVVEGSSGPVANTYFTANLQPAITISFFAAGNTLLKANLTKSTGQVYVPTVSSLNGQVFSLQFVNPLSLGQYVLSFSAVNAQGLVMPPINVNIVINNLPTQINITQPQQGQIVSNNLVTFVLNASDAVWLRNFTIRGPQNFTYNSSNQAIHFASPLPATFSSLVNSINLSDGLYSVFVKVQNPVGLESTAARLFTVDALPPQVQFVQPQNGVSQTYTFDVVVQSVDNASCRYFFSPFNAPHPGVENYPAYWFPFNRTTGYIHTKFNFNYPASSTAPYLRFFVACEGANWPVSEATVTQLNLSVDTTSPNITNAFITPLYEYPLTTTFTVQTNEVSQCRYGTTNLAYNLLPYAFPINVVEPYRTLNIAPLTLMLLGNAQHISQNYVVVCENLAGLRSQPRTVAAVVNLNAPLQATDHSPKFVSSSVASINLETNKNAICNYGNNPQYLPNGVGNQTPKRIHVQDVAVGLGANSFYVVCSRVLPLENTGIFLVNITYDDTSPVILYVSDNSTLNNSEQTPFTNKLRVKWNSIDDESGVAVHYYRVEYVSNSTVAIDWVSSILNDEYVEVLGTFSDKTRYKFGVIASNGAGMNSSIVYSDGILVNVSATTAHCSNGIKDGYESGVDCGSSSGCALCPLGQGCLSNADCNAGFCNAISSASSYLTCISPQCNDGLKNGAESDIDCGGSCTDCTNNKTCSGNGDCQSNFCNPTTNTCKPFACNDGFINGNESDVDCGGSCTDCLIDDNCRVNADCQSGYCTTTATNQNRTCQYASCTDGVRNGAESDVDCGGTCANDCADNKTCSANSDCQSGYCNPTTDKCSTINCNDGQLNGAESDVDCGGGDCEPCDDGDKCEVDDDCLSEQCDASRRRCDDFDKCDNGRQDPAESDVDCGGPCPQKCEEGAYCVNSLDCESGLTCLETTDKCAFCSPGDPSCSQTPSTDVDSDSDGIPDVFESQNGLDPNDASDASLDADADGLTNVDEFNLGTNVQNPDTDGDGASDGDEFTQGSDPLDPDSLPGDIPSTKGGHLWNVILLVIGFIALIGGGAYLYVEFQKPKGGMPPSFPPPRPLPPPMPPPQRRPSPPQRPSPAPIPPQAKEVFSHFDEPKALKPDITATLKGDKNVFDQLRDISRDTPREQDRAMVRLENLVKEKKKK